MEPTHVIESHRYTETLPVPLNDHEVLERSATLSRMIQERDSLDSEIKAQAAQKRALLKEKDATLRRVSEEVRNKQTFRPVDCETLFDYTDGEAIDVRLDTKAEIGRRKLTHEEKQRKLGFPKQENEPDATDTDKGAGEPEGDDGPLLAGQGWNDLEPKKGGKGKGKSKAAKPAGTPKRSRRKAN